jgi:dephospho-CoA kinase
MKRATESPSRNIIRLCDADVRIGIAGYMGSGKSTCAHILAEGDAVVIDADREAKTLMESSGTIKRGLVSAFGNDVLQKGNIRFDLLGGRAFRSIATLRTLNRIVHPPLIERLYQRIHGVRDSLCILDAALIPLWRIGSWFDIRIWVDARQNTRLDRLMMKNSGIDRNSLQKRMRIQERLYGKPRGRGWRMVANDGSIEELRKHIASIVIT